MIIIGITGTIGAGKGSIVDYLAQEKGFAHYSARDFLTAEIARRGLPMNRESLSFVSNDLRRTKGPHVIAEALYNQAAANGKNAIVEALRNPAEVIFLKNNKDFFMLAVDAEAHLRYDRIVKRGLYTDHVTFDEFKQIDDRETTSTDPTAQNVRACVDMADAVINNDGTIQDLGIAVDKALEKFFIKEHVS
jgi:dephospho-CoA kinase